MRHRKALDNAATATAAVGATEFIGPQLLPVRSHHGRNRDVIALQELHRQFEQLPNHTSIRRKWDGEDNCGLGLLGADDLRFFRDLSPAKAFQLCSITSIPLGVDDPDSKGSFSKVIMDLYNGAKRGTISKGEAKPISTVVISSNITPIEQQRSDCFGLVTLSITQPFLYIDTSKSKGMATQQTPDLRWTATDS